MNSEKLPELTERSAEGLESLFKREMMLQLGAKEAVMREIEAMRSEDKILELTDEEERMLRSFRAFRLRCKPGGVFKWQTRPEAAPLIESESTGLIQDPQDVSR